LGSKISLIEHPDKDRHLFERRRSFFLKMIVFLKNTVAYFLIKFVCYFLLPIFVDKSELQEKQIR